MSMQLPEIIPDLKKYSFIYRMGMLFANLYGIIQLQQTQNNSYLGNESSQGIDFIPAFSWVLIQINVLSKINFDPLGICNPQ